jgi:two-component system sensor histidine kinase HydH
MPGIVVPKFFANLRIRYAIIITLLLAAILFFIAFFGIQRSKSNMLRVMEKQGTALLESLILSSRNAIKANSLVEELVGERLLNVAVIVDRLEREKEITDSKLSEIARESDLWRIDIFDQMKRLVKSSNPQDKRIYQDTAQVPFSMIDLVLKEEQDQIAFEISGEGAFPENRYAVAIRRTQSEGVIVAIASAAYMESFKKEIGIGYLIQKISQQAGIEYIVLQSKEGIVFASKKVERMLKIESDPFLQESLEKNIASSRIFPFEGREVFEVVKPFTSEEFPSGIFRLGMSLESYHEVSQRYQLQMIILALVMFLLGLLFIGIVVVNQSYFVLDRSYKQIKTLTGNVLESMHSAVISVDEEGKIIIFNSLAESLFSMKKEGVINKNYDSIFPEDEPLLKKALEHKRTFSGVEREFRTFAGKDKYLIISTSTISDEKGKLSGAVAVIHDITELKKYEEEAKRTERLTALGTLAAGVAHEVRNPLNAIAITAQRLKNEFVPQMDVEEYKSFTQTILSEIKRMDQIINQFLSLAKAQKLNLVKTDINQFLNEIINLVEIEAKNKGIEIAKKMERLSEIEIDKDEMKKALLNILRNGVEVTPSGEKMWIEAKGQKSENEIHIKIRDSGPGIPKENVSKIFQPYFTTKQKGAGLGLAIAYRIVSDHRGKIEVQSQEGKGTTFIIKLPLTEG